MTLVPPHTDYAGRIFAWRNERHTLLHNPIEPATLDTIREKLASAPRDFSPIDDKTTHRWFCKVDEQIVGTVSFGNFNTMMKHAEIGYMIGEEYYGRGYGREATRLWINKIFAETPARKLLSFVAEENVASNRIMERLGFAREGFLREHYLINNEPVNEILWGLLKSEWRG